MPHSAHSRPFKTKSVHVTPLLKTLQWPLLSQIWLLPVSPMWPAPGGLSGLIPCHAWFAWVTLVSSLSLKPAKHAPTSAVSNTVLSPECCSFHHCALKRLFLQASAQHRLARPRHVKQQALPTHQPGGNSLSASSCFPPEHLSPSDKYICLVFVFPAPSLTPLLPNTSFTKAETLFYYYIPRT